MTDLVAVLNRPVRVRNGDPTPLQRLQRRSTIDPTGCWTWNGAVNSKGYGSVAFNGVTVLVHRLSYFLTHGDLPDGMHVDHECHNRDATCPGGVTCAHRRCWRPSHLAAVTCGENNLRVWLGRPEQMRRSVLQSARVRKERARRRKPA